jgi:C_GCAxxG_C_C family probable redox protein
VDASIQNAADLPARIGARAKNLFLSRQMYCSEAVLVTLNQGLGGSLEEYQALALAAPFSEGVGKSGCMCGALGGALLAIGLFIGGTHPVQRRARVQKAANDFIERFKARFGSSCCRILSKKSANDSPSRFAHCSELTGQAAASAAELIFEHRPELMHVVDICFLDTQDSAVGGFIKNTMRYAGRCITPAPAGCRRR